MEGGDGGDGNETNKMQRENKNRHHEKEDEKEKKVFPGDQRSTPTSINVRFGEEFAIGTGFTQTSSAFPRQYHSNNALYSFILPITDAL